MAAVLDDAIRTFCRTVRSRKIGDQPLFQDTAEWFASSDIASPFAFERICLVLGLDAEEIRGRLYLWQRIVHDEDEPPRRCVDPNAAHHRTLARVGTFAGCLMLGAVALLGAIVYQTWALAHVVYF